MSVAEALSEGLQVTVVGLTIVFSVLLILMLVLMAMKTIFYKPAAPVKANSAAKKNETTTAAAPDVKTGVTDKIDEGELIAVLTAAVAASLNTSTYNLNIKSYRRVGNSSPNWNRAGLNDVINSRF